MKFKEFVLRYKRILFISFAAAISFLLLCLIGFYFWLNYHTMAQVGDFKITRKVVLDNIASNRDYILTVKGKDANLESETYQILLQKKAVEYETTKRGITVSNTDLDAEILNISTDGSAKTYYNTVAASYGWSKTDADSQVRTRMLKDKLESIIVGSYDVRNFYVRSNTEPKLGETAAQIKAKALELITKARQDAISGASFQQIKDGITASSATWTGDMTHGWGNVTGLNESNEAEKLANGRFWPEIAKLSKSGDVTGVIDATNEGSLYVFWQLESKNTGTYKTMDEFYQSFQPKSAINEFLLKMTPSAYAACNNWLNDNVNTAGEIAWYRISNFKIYLREASTNAQITNRANATVTMSNIEPATGHCDSSWCNMGQTKSIGTGSTIFYNSCCQFTYAISVSGMDGYTLSHVHRKGIESGDDVTTQYPTHFNSINGINNLYGYFDYNPIVSTITPSADLGCIISPNTAQTVSYGGTQGFTGSANTNYLFNGFSVDGGTTTPGASYSFSNVITSHTIVAKCTPPIIPTCSISASPNPATTTGGPVTLTYATTNATSATWSVDGVNPVSLLPLVSGSKAGAGGKTYSIAVESSTGNSNTCSVKVGNPGTTTATLISAVLPVGAATPNAAQFADTSSVAVTKTAGYTNVSSGYNPNPTWTSDTAGYNTCPSVTFLARKTDTVTCTATFTPVVVNNPLTVALDSPANWAGGEATYTTDVSGGTAAVELKAHAADADAGESIFLTISYQSAGADDWSTGTVAGHITVNGTLSADLPAGNYWWFARARTSNSADIDTNLWPSGLMETPLRLMHIVDPPDDPKVSCSVTPLLGESPLVVRVHLNPMDGATGPYEYKMDAEKDETRTSNSAEFWYTYAKAGVYKISAKAANTDWEVCSPAEGVTVKDPTSNTGGEVAP